MKITKVVFPEQGRPIWELFAPLKHVVSELKKFRHDAGAGHVMSYPSFMATLIWRLLLPFNPGNLGNWSIWGKDITNITGRYEAMVIRMMLDVLNVSAQRQWEGYVTSGATEANIFMSWVGRKYLSKKQVSVQKMIVITTSLSHYSLTKAADITGLEVATTAVRQDWAGIDAPALLKLLTQLYTKGYRGFLIPFTYGFTLTGTDDKVEEVLEEIHGWQQTHPAHFFYWIDAAMAGLVKPFIGEFAPLNHPEISGIAVDFHKYGRVSLPAGLLLYQQKLRSLIEQPIPYLSEADNTVLGSRTGISPVAVWADITLEGKKGYARRVKKNLRQKQHFIETYSQEKDLTIITHPENINAGIIINAHSTKWLKHFRTVHDIYFEQVEILFSKGPQKFLVGKAYFMR
jgi:tyrosine decarboxylase / aspartate 1-decarboxylase